jgi:hypothetical protein
LRPGITFVTKNDDESGNYDELCAAIASDGLTTIGSSETVTGPLAEPGVKTATAHGPLPLYLPPIHVLFIGPQGRAAYTLTDRAGATLLRMLP